MSDTNKPDQIENPERAQAQGSPWYAYVIRIILVLLILGIGAAVSFYWMTHRPQATRQKPVTMAQLVEVSRVEKGPCDIVVEAMGTVVPAQSVELAAQVSGKVVSLAPQFVPGDRFASGKMMLKLEPDDYRLIVQQRSSELARAQAELKLEMGQQSIAQREYELLRADVQDEDKELLLRQPQLATAKANVASVMASLEKAELDLKRTTVVAPFNAMVQTRNVDLGSQATAGMSLASLIGTDEYWIQLSLPVDQLKWVNIPGAQNADGSKARVYCETAWGADEYRTGRVLRLMPDLEPEGRMARLLVSVKDPLGLQANPSKKLPLILSTYVRVEIEGRGLQQAACIPREALHDGNRVWIMQPDHTLAIRDVTIVWSSNENVYVTDGLEHGDALITSNLAAPVTGMALRTSDMPITAPAEPDEKMVEAEVKP